jgi:hypothetical protein
MNTAGKLTAFVAAVAVAFGGAMAVGGAVGPIDVGSADSDHDTTSPVADAPTRGLAVAQDGYRLIAGTTAVAAATPAPFTFRIVDDAGTSVTAFDELHERRLHLIVLSRNLVDYLHLHPTLDPSGEWTVELPALEPGSYRVFADFQPAGGDNLTLATDLTVPGNVAAVDPPARAIVDDIGDGYTVTLAGTPRVGDTELAFDVSLSGDHVVTEPYLGAAGHLVAIRTGDLAYLHVHPHDDEESDAVVFTAELPTAGTYRTVRTASFTIEVPPGGVSTSGDTDTDTTHDDEGH